MRLYKDIFTGDEMFSDTYKMKLVDEVIYEVYGKLVTRKQGDIQLDGFNPSAEEVDEGTDETVESGVDVVLNHRLCETYAFGDKKSYTAYLKDYMKKLVSKLEEKDPSQVDVFKTNMNKVMKELLGRFKDLQFFTGIGLSATLRGNILPNILDPYTSTSRLEQLHAKLSCPALNVLTLYGSGLLEQSAESHDQTTVDCRSSPPVESSSVLGNTIGESMDVDGMVALLEYRDIENESVPVLMFFKHGLEEEKL